MDGLSLPIPGFNEYLIFRMEGKIFMARETLDRKIKHLQDEVLILDSMVEQAVVAAVEALKNHDVESARRLYQADAMINAKRFEIENETMVTIATQQPIMATDLRLLASILEVTGELERIGDYGKGIAHICVKIGNEPHIKPLVDIPRMLEIAVDMLHQAVGAFIAADAETARLIPTRDDEVDDLYNQVYRDLVAIIGLRPETIDQANFLMWAAHNLERMADRVTNICERTIYIASGEMREIDSTDDETRRA
jgi:phosphate transport system protein